MKPERCGLAGLLLPMFVACEVGQMADPSGSPVFDEAQDSPVHQVSAGGTSELSGFGEARIALIASLDSSGAINGQFQMYAATGDVIHHAVITCLFVEGSQAWVGIEITRSEDPAFVGRQGLLRVVDNGEGALAPPDQRSSVFGAAGIGSRCAEKPNFALLDWTQGNVQIR